MRKFRSSIEFPIVIVALVTLAILAVGIFVAIFLPLWALTIWGFASTALFIILGGFSIGYMLSVRR